MAVSRSILIFPNFFVLIMTRKMSAFRAQKSVPKSSPASCRAVRECYCESLHKVRRSWRPNASLNGTFIIRLLIQHIVLIAYRDTRLSLSQPVLPSVWLPQKSEGGKGEQRQKWSASSCKLSLAVAENVELCRSCFSTKAHFVKSLLELTRLGICTTLYNS